MLCSLCAELVQWDTANHWEFVHHSSYSALRGSASNGCQLCSFLKQVLLSQYSHDLPSTVEEAEGYHLAVDRVEQYEKNADRSIFIVENHEIQVDDRFAPYEQGSRGFSFVRRCMYDDALPMRDIWTFVSFVVPIGSKAQSHGRIIGAPLLPEPDISIGKQWIVDCKNNHRLCVAMAETPLPTRLLDVGPIDGSQHPRLMITEGAVGQYATLSHRWGQSHPVSLTKDTYSPYLQCIPFSSLPKTFQDAITVTRQLGFQYLWIDSLCIYQDSSEDWAKECVKMPGTYKNAQVNIAGPSAADCHAGFLYKRMTSSVDPLEVDWQAAQGQKTEKVRLVYIGPEEMFVPQPETRSVLATRAWILQERLLSQRVLYFGSKKMYWECCTNVRYEDLHFPLVDDFQSRNEVEKFSFNVPQNRNHWLRTWYCIVETYSGTEMTFLSDKFPAISALANEIAKILKDEYIAGLWKTDLLKGLTWNVPVYMTDELGLKGPIDYLAPSWSWASARKQITFMNKSFDYDRPNSDVEILDVFVEPKTADIFGQLQRSSIKIRGKLFKARIRRGPDEFVSERKVWYAFSQARDEKLGTYLPDDKIQESETSNTAAGDAPKQNETEGFELQFLYLGQPSGPGPNPDWMGIVVEKSPESPTQYRRRGLLHGSGSTLSDRKGWFNSACPSILEMI